MCSGACPGAFMRPRKAVDLCWRHLVSQAQCGSVSVQVHTEDGGVQAEDACRWVTGFQGCMWFWVEE